MEFKLGLYKVIAVDSSEATLKVISHGTDLDTIKIKHHGQIPKVGDLFRHSLIKETSND